MLQSKYLLISSGNFGPFTNLESLKVEIINSIQMFLSAISENITRIAHFKVQ
jgi:hypothetical protein